MFWRKIIARSTASNGITQIHTMEKHKGQYPAYPFPGFDGAGKFPPQKSATGLLVRDYIAIEAMKAVITAGDIPSKDAADYAYECADAMLDIREN